jgi:pyridoxal phosphate enzyme (YggS family)
MTEKSLNDPLGYIDENIKRIAHSIENTAIKANRDPREIKLIAVTKTVSAEAINRAIDCNVREIGENKAQELLQKLPFIHPDEVHFIGHLQTNKVRQIIDKVDLIHSVDSLKLAAEIDKQACLLGKVKDILIEVNIGGEKSKSGVASDAIFELLESIADLKSIKTRGLMVIPPSFEPPEPFFEKIYKLFIDIRAKKIDNILMDYLSMGMSNDYVEAIKEGSNIIRVGTAIFGNRNY